MRYALPIVVFIVAVAIGTWVGSQAYGHLTISDLGPGPSVTTFYPDWGQAVGLGLMAGVVAGGLTLVAVRLVRR